VQSSAIFIQLCLFSIPLRLCTPRPWRAWAGTPHTRAQLLLTIMVLTPSVALLCCMSGMVQVQVAGGCSLMMQPQCCQSGVHVTRDCAHVQNALPFELRWLGGHRPTNLTFMITKLCISWSSFRKLCSGCQQREHPIPSSASYMAIQSPHAAPVLRGIEYVHINSRALLNAFIIISSPHVCLVTSHNMHGHECCMLLVDTLVHCVDPTTDCAVDHHPQLTRSHTFTHRQDGCCDGGRGNYGAADGAGM
jgi:hypothetical protein